MAATGNRLASETLGALPLVNHVLARAGIPEALARVDRDAATRVGPTPAQCLGVLLRNIVLDRGPVYALSGWGSPVRDDLLGLAPGDADHLNDDRVGRALDRLFDADRASLQTEVVVRMIREFHVNLDQLHNDSTTLKLTGTYVEADGGLKRGKPTLKAARGHSKDHRPDLKQLLWDLTVTADGAVPIHYRAYDGNQNDAPTHQETWDAVRALKGDADFLYIADSKGSGSQFLQSVHAAGGRFVVVLPRTRAEDAWFRDHVQANAVAWEHVAPRPDEEPEDGSDEVDAWSAAEAPTPSAEGFRVVWLRSQAKARRDRHARHAMMTRAVRELAGLDERLQSPRCKITTRQGVVEAADAVASGPVARWVAYEIREEDVVSFKQERRGRPGKHTRYRRMARPRFRVSVRVDDAAVAYDAASDGMFPLITNTRRPPPVGPLAPDQLSLAKVFAAYKYQPRLEKRHEQLKSVYAAAPVFLKSITRIEALLFLYFLAMIVQALLERQVRRAMASQGLKTVPLYPEGRACAAPTADKVLAVFQAVQVHRLVHEGRVAETFWPDLTPLQRQLLALAGVPEAAYRAPAA